MYYIHEQEKSVSQHKGLGEGGVEEAHPYPTTQACFYQVDPRKYGLHQTSSVTLSEPAATTGITSMATGLTDSPDMSLHVSSQS